SVLPVNEDTVGLVRLAHSVLLRTLVLDQHQLAELWPQPRHLVAKHRVQKPDASFTLLRLEHDDRRWSSSRWPLVEPDELSDDRVTFSGRNPRLGELPRRPLGKMRSPVL